MPAGEGCSLPGQPQNAELLHVVQMPCWCAAARQPTKFTRTLSSEVLDLKRAPECAGKSGGATKDKACSLCCTLNAQPAMLGCF